MSIPTHQLEQVFFILIQRAIDAVSIKKKQKLTISCHTSERQIELRFSDTCGLIDPERIEHIFEPFFVAKAGEKGTNRDLVIARQIVGSFGGQIIAESQPETGTIFHVILPIEKVH